MSAKNFAADSVKKNDLPGTKLAARMHLRTNHRLLTGRLRLRFIDLLRFIWWVYFNN